MSKWGALLTDVQTGAQDEDLFGDVSPHKQHQTGASTSATGAHSERESVDPSPITGGSQSGRVHRTESGSSFYVINGPPPLTGPGAPTDPTAIMSVNVPYSEKQNDVSGKEVVWYHLHVRTQTHQWFVLKRYSDANTFHDSLKGVGLQLDNFPSKQLFAKQDDAFIAKRREGLDMFFRGFLFTLKKMLEKSLDENGVLFNPQLQLKAMAAFGLFMDFCRVSSRSNAGAVTGRTQTLLKPREPNQGANAPSTLKGGDGTSLPKPGSKSGSKIDLTDSPGTPSIPPQPLPGHRYIPQTRVLLQPKVRFCVMMYLPGVTMADVYVGPNARDETSVVVGGKWGAPERLFAAVTSPVAKGEPQLSSSTGAGGMTPMGSKGNSARTGPGRLIGPDGGEWSILMDTLPTDEFEMLFDIPPQFDRNDWKSDYADGVLYIVWDAKPKESVASGGAVTGGRSRSTGPGSSRRSSSGVRASNARARSNSATVNPRGSLPPQNESAIPAAVVEPKETSNSLETVNTSVTPRDGSGGNE